MISAVKAFKHGHYLAGAGLICATTAVNATPVVAGNQLEWTEPGWYQVQRSDDFSTVCEGPDFCPVQAGSYIVINHSTGERWENIQVTDNSASEVSGNSGTPAVNTVTADKGTILFPNNDWYQVQNASTFTSVCEGSSPCDVPAGTYIVINHSTGERLEEFVVASIEPVDNNSSPAITAPSEITVSGDTLSWPDDGWYQLQSAVSYETICEGGTSCVVSPGTYNLINHTTGQRFENIAVIEQSGVADVDATPDATPANSVDANAGLLSTINASNAAQLLQEIGQLTNENSFLSAFESSEVGRWVTQRELRPTGFNELSSVNTREPTGGSTTETLYACPGSGTVEHLFLLGGFSRTLSRSFDFNNCSDGEIIYNGEATHSLFSSFSGRSNSHSYNDFRLTSAQTGELLGTWDGTARGGQFGTLDDRSVSYEFNSAEYAGASGNVRLENLQRSGIRILDNYNAISDSSDDGVFIAQSLDTGVYFFVSQAHSAITVSSSFTLSANSFGNTAISVEIENLANARSLRSADLPQGQSLPVAIRLSERCPADVDRCESENRWQTLQLNSSAALNNWESTRLRAVAGDGSELMVVGSYSDDGVFSQTATITASDGAQEILSALEQTVRLSETTAPWEALWGEPGDFFDLRAQRR